MRLEPPGDFVWFICYRGVARRTSEYIGWVLVLVFQRA